MSGYLGLGGSHANKPVVYSRIQLSSSQMDMPLPIFWGQRRLGTAAIWYGDFQKHSQSAKGKGGGGKGSRQYDYTAAVILALSEGVIDSIANVWPQGSTTTTTSLAKLNFTFFNGTAVQAPWSYTTTKFPAQARSYALTSYVANPKMDLGSSATIQDNGFECVRANGFTYTVTSNGYKNPTTGTVTTAIDVLMSDVLTDFLTNVQYGMGFSAGDLASMTQYANYCRAQGLVYSPLLKAHEKATSIIDRWANLSNSWIYWSGTQLQVVPLGDTAITANGVTYTPDTAIAYNLGLGDFTDKENPVKVTRADPADCYNRTVMQITDRTLGYIANPVEWKDQTLVDLYGPRDASSTQADEICNPAVGAIVVQLLGKRAAYIRNNYSFKTTYRYIRCLPGTILTLTTKRLNAVRVRVKTVEEDESGELSFECEEFPGTIGTFIVPTQTTASTAGNQGTPNQNVLPGSVNTPAVIEPNSAYTQGIPQIIVAASGGANWGGCDVNISFDGVNYSFIGSINAAAAQGVLTATLPLHADPDTVDTLAVDCTQSQTTPQTVSHSDADNLRTLSLVVGQPVGSNPSVIPNNGELLAFGNTATTGTYAANLTYLRRGKYGTVPAAHSIGDQFTVVDVVGTTGSSVVYKLPPQYIGQTVYLKLQSFNSFGNSLEDLSTVVEYSYTPTGAGFGSGAGGVPSAPTGVAVTPVSGVNTVSWNSNPSTDNVTAYQVWRATGASQPFSAATQQWSGLSTSWPDPNVTSGQAYTYFVVAVNLVGSSLPSTATNATTSTVTFPFRAVGGTPGRKPLAAEELFNAIMRTGDQLASGLPNSYLKCEVAPTASWTITLKQNGTTIGTGTIAAGATTGTWSFSSTVSFTNGDLFTGSAPASQDTTCSGVSYSIAGTRTQ